MKNILETDFYISDIKRVVDSLDHFEFPVSKSILITGSTGLICSAIVDVLFFLNKKKKLNWNIIAAARNIKKAHERFSEYGNDACFSCFEYDANKKNTFPVGIDYIIHGAGNAYPAAFNEFPAETMSMSIYSLEKILQYSTENKSRVLYISSSEVYGQLQNSEPIKENEYGYVDILNPRSAYPMGKRAAETLCSSYIKEFSSDCVIVRPGHIYGPTASKSDNRVSSDFMYKAANGENLILKSDGKQNRSYCYCLDCASAIITVLLNGKCGEAYNISNKDSICSIREMAENFARIGNVQCNFDIPKETEKKAFNPMMNSSLDSKKLEALGWKAVFEKKEGFEHSVNICRNILAEN